MSMILTSHSAFTKLLAQATAGATYKTHKIIFHLPGSDKRPFSLRCSEQKLQSTKQIEVLEYFVCCGNERKPY